MRLHQTTSKKRFDLEDLPLWWLAGAFFIGLVVLNHWMLYNLLYLDQDLAFLSQVSWNVFRGSWNSSVLGVNFLANHFCLMLYPVALINGIFPGPEALLVIQAAALTAGGILAHRLAGRFLPKPMPLFAAAAYFLYPPILYAGVNEFHHSALAIPFVFLTLIAFVDKQFGRFLIWACLAMTVQENFALAITMFGVLALVERRAWRWVILPALLGTAWFGVVVFLIQPRLNNGNIDMLILYRHLGQNWPEILMTLITRMDIWLSREYVSESAVYLMRLIGPFLFLPVLGWVYCLPVLPFYFWHTLTVGGLDREFIGYHFTDFIPFLIAASSLGFSRLSPRLSNPWIKHLFAAGILVAYGLVIVLSHRSLIALDGIKRFQVSPAISAKRVMISKIPEKASVVATFEFMPLLSQRKDLYSFHHVYKGSYTHSDRPYALDDVDYAILNMKDEFTFGSFRNEKSDSLLKGFMEKFPWEALDSVDDTVLLKKGIRRLDRLFRVNPPDESPALNTTPVSLNNEIQFDGFEFDTDDQAAKGVLGIKFYWRSLKKISHNYRVMVTLSKNGMPLYTYAHRICYRLYEPTDWRVGDRVVETVRMAIPRRLSGVDLTLSCQLIDLGVKHDGS